MLEPAKNMLKWQEKILSQRSVCSECFRQHRVKPAPHDMNITPTLMVMLHTTVKRKTPDVATQMGKSSHRGNRSKVKNECNPDKDNTS